MNPDQIEIALRVAHVLEEQHVRYVEGGSLASSIAGEPRSTLDVDVIVELSDDKVAAVVAALGEDFYADADGIRQAIREKSSANLIHLATSIKVDVFIMGGSPIDEEQMDRRLRLRVDTDPDQYLFVYTPEDILLQKLRWYQMGNEVSDRQWRDIMGIVVVQGKALDVDYLRRAAQALAVSDLLQRAFDQAGDRS